MRPGPIRVVLAEDGVLAREGIVRIVASAEDIELVATCETLAEVRAAVVREQPDVLLTPPSSRRRIRRWASSC